MYAWAEYDAQLEVVHSVTRNQGTESLIAQTFIMVLLFYHSILLFVQRLGCTKTIWTPPQANVRWSLQGDYAAFLSHYKLEAAQEARYVKEKLAGELGSSVFLDSDDLSDLRTLCQVLLQCDVLVLFLTEGLLTRPWCIIELYTAITNGVPIVALRVAGRYPYDFADAQRFLDNFENALEERNPGAGAVVLQHLDDVTLADVGNALKDTVPNIIAKGYDPAASSGIINAQIQDLITAMEAATGQSSTAVRSSNRSAGTF